MATKLVRLTLALACLAVAGCRAAPAPPPAEPSLLANATIKDIMDSMIDPSADFVFESVATIADEKGVREIAPQTDEEWAEVRRRAVQLLEAPNLLVMKGRTVARPGDKAQNAGIELEPAQIQALIDGDRTAFVNHARALQDAATVALRAIDAHDKTALFESADAIDQACEGCHLKYWYPNDQKAQEAFKQNAK
jgi:hypothetical protein